MTRHQRKQLFALAAVVVLGALMAISAIDRSGEQTPPRAPIGVGIAPTISDPRVGATSQHRSTDDHAAGRADGPLLQPRRVARRFIATFARYQSGPIDTPTARQLQALATPQLASYLLSHPPRDRTARRMRVRIVRLDIVASEDGAVKAAALLDYGQRRRSLLELQLEPWDGSWRVSALYPSGG